MGVVARQHRGAAGHQTFEDLGLGLGDGLAGEGKYSRCTGLHRGDHGDVRAHHLRRAARSRRRGSCRSRRCRTRRRAACAPGSAARPSGCCRTSPRRAPRPASSRARRSISLVPVLPTLPVTATIRALLRARAARAIACRAASESPARSSGAIARRRGGSLGDQRAAAPLLEGVADEIVAVALGLQGDEHVARRNRARVDGEAGDASRRRAVGAGLRRGDQLVPLPQGLSHARSVSVSTARTTS